MGPPRISAKAFVRIPILLLMIVPVPLALARAQSVAPRTQAEVATENELTSLLRQFLDSARRSDRAGFERFFADDVIYTGSNGLVRNKVDILARLDKTTHPAEMQTSYCAEDIVVHNHGDTAVVAFRLVAQTKRKDGTVETMNYRNTGTFLRRNGAWQAVAWQSTKVPERPDPDKELRR